jgi:hypothetical protein
MIKGEDQFQQSKIIKPACPNKVTISSNRCAQPLIAIILSLCISHAVADDSLPESINHDKQHAGKSEIGIGVGALVFLGADFRILYRKSDSPWVFGIRYIDIKDDFVNESYVGLPNDESDKEYTRRIGVYSDYLFNKRPNTGSFYLSGALYRTTIKIECGSESDSDSATSLYFGGGYKGSFTDNLEYSVGILVSPFSSSELSTSTCSSSSSGDFDLNLSLILKF